MWRPELLFTLALVFYTMAIISNQVLGKLGAWIVWVFGTALACDIVGTLTLCVFTSGAWRWTVHSMSGLAALMVMALHFTWGMMAFRRPQHADRFHRWSGLAWLLWLSAFVSGLPTTTAMKFIVAWYITAAASAVWAIWDRLLLSYYRRQRSS